MFSIQVKIQNISRTLEDPIRLLLSHFRSLEGNIFKIFDHGSILPVLELSLFL